MNSSAGIWPGENRIELCPKIQHQVDKTTYSAWSTSWQHPHAKTVYALTLSQSTHTSEADLEACYSLVEKTSRKDYEASSRGWNPEAKKEEMREPDLRYILVKDHAAGGVVCGYTSLMPTMEDGEPVLYCYEIHLKPDLRGTGLAALLMGLLETAATNIDIMDKVMLTVFTCNHRAMAFYQRCGFEVDETSPQPRRLRNGVVKRPDYAIMSKTIDRRRRAVPAPVGHVDSSKDGVMPDNSISRRAKIAKLDQSKMGQIESIVTEGVPKYIRGCRPEDAAGS